MVDVESYDASSVISWVAAVQGQHAGARGWFTDPPALYTQKHPPPTACLLQGLAQGSAFAFLFLSSEESESRRGKTCKYEDIHVIVFIKKHIERGKNIIYCVYNLDFSAHCFSQLLIFNPRTSLTRSLLKNKLFVFREQKDPFYLREKLSQKHSKEQFEAAQKIEQDYSRFFTGWSKEANILGLMNISAESQPRRVRLSVFPLHSH